MRALVFLLALPLAACVEADRDVAAREVAKAAIRPVLASRLPGLPVEPAVDCVIDNASASELLSLASAAALRQPTPESTNTVLSIVTRPETVRCLLERGAPLLQGAIAAG